MNQTNTFSHRALRLYGVKSLDQIGPLRDQPRRAETRDSDSRIGFSVPRQQLRHRRTDRLAGCPR
jgi:hypothetical protein